MSIQSNANNSETAHPTFITIAMGLAPLTYLTKHNMCLRSTVLVFDLKALNFEGKNCIPDHEMLKMSFMYESVSHGKYFIG